MLTDVNHIAKVKKIMNLYFILPCSLKQKRVVSPFLILNC